MSVGSFSIPFTFLDSNFRSYGPQGASGSMDTDIYHEYYDNGNFDVSYQAILPDGTIDTTGGYADVDMNVIDVNIFTGATTNTFIQFQGEGVPEPSSLVLAASGILIVSIFAWMRGFTGR